MSILRLIIKSAIAYCLTAFVFKPGTMGSTVVMFALMYGLATYYIWYFTNNDDSLDMLDGSFIGFGITLIAPLFVIYMEFYILEKILPGEVGQYVFSATVLIGSFACLIHDIVSIIRIFSPSFMEFDGSAESGFLDDHSVTDDNSYSGYDGRE